MDKVNHVQTDTPPGGTPNGGQTGGERGLLSLVYCKKVMASLRLEKDKVSLVILDKYFNFLHHFFLLNVLLGLCLRLILVVRSEIVELDSNGLLMLGFTYYTTVPQLTVLKPVLRIRIRSDPVFLGQSDPDPDPEKNRIRILYLHLAVLQLQPTFSKLLVDPRLSLSDAQFYS